MENGEVSEAGKALLKAFAALSEQHQAPTVQSAAIMARLTFMESMDEINRLFNGGYLRQDLTLTDQGRKLVKAATAA